MGAPQQLFGSSFGIIQKLRNRIRTVYGDSTLFFSCLDNATPIQCVGQRNEAGPQIWAAASSFLYDMLREAGHGFHCATAISRRCIYVAGIGFVDDNELATLLRLVQASLNEAIKDAQAGLRMWDGGAKLRVSPLLAFQYCDYDS